MDEHSARARCVLDSKRAYLNCHFFLVRAIVFFAFFIIASQLLRRFSVRQDKDGNPLFTIWMRKVSFISLPLFALCLTFGAVDWLMSLNYHWYSTMFGVYIFAGAAGSSMWLARAGDHRSAPGRLSERGRHARALPHHGEMDARPSAFSGPTSALANTCSSGTQTSPRRRNISSSETRNPGGR